MIIDSHVHIWTPDTTHYPLASGWTQEDMQPSSFTPEELFRHARPSKVERIVLIQIAYYSFDNSYMLDAIKRYRDELPGGIFGGVAIIDADGDSPDDEMRRLLEDGVRGFRIYGANYSRNGRRAMAANPDWLTGPGIDLMFRTAAETRQSLCMLIDPSDLPAIDAACARNPETPVVIDHMARVGFGDGIPDADLLALCGIARHRNIKVKISAFYGAGLANPPHDDLIPMMRRLFDAFGPERLMWASDCPFQVDNETYEDSLSLIRDRLDFLSASDREWLLGKTAEKTYF